MDQSLPDYIVICGRDCIHVRTTDVHD